jgi:hypothetical protein
MMEPAVDLPVDPGQRPKSRTEEMIYNEEEKLKNM